MRDAHTCTLVYLSRYGGRENQQHTSRCFVSHFGRNSFAQFFPPHNNMRLSQDRGQSHSEKRMDLRVCAHVPPQASICLNTEDLPQFSSCVACQLWCDCLGQSLREFGRLRKFSMRGPTEGELLEQIVSARLGKAH